MKRLVQLASEDGSQYDFFALVNQHTDETVVRELVNAAIGDANREDAANLRNGTSGTNSGLSVKADIKRRLEPLGFEFFPNDNVTTVGYWDGANDDPSLFEVRLKHAGIKFTMCPTSGLVKIPTATGTIAMDVSKESWACEAQGTTGSLRGTGFEQLEKLISLRGQL